VHDRNAWLHLHLIRAMSNDSTDLVDVAIHQSKVAGDTRVVNKGHKNGVSYLLRYGKP
jgi:hypothetical protein